MSSFLPTEQPETLAVTLAEIAALPNRLSESTETEIPNPANRWSRRRDAVTVHRGTALDLMADAARSEMNKPSTENGNLWSGGSFATALHLAYDGWRDAVDLVEDLFVSLTTERTESILPTMNYVEEPGGEPDAALALGGEDACWLDVVQSAFAVPVSGRFLNFALDPFASWNIDATTVCKRGLYLAALVLLAERAGYRTRVCLVMPSSGSGRDWRVEVTLKEYEDCFDLPRLMFWLAHPSALRHFIIGAYNPHRNDGIGSREYDYPDGTITAPPFTGDFAAWFKRATTDYGIRLTA